MNKIINITKKDTIWCGIARDHTGFIKEEHEIGYLMSFYDPEYPSYPFTFGMLDNEIYSTYRYHFGDKSFLPVFYKLTDISIQIDNDLKDVFEKSLALYRIEIRDIKIDDILS